MKKKMKKMKMMEKMMKKKRRMRMSKKGQTVMMKITISMRKIIMNMISVARRVPSAQEGEFELQKKQ